MKLNSKQEKRALAFEDPCLRKVLDIMFQENVINIEDHQQTSKPFVSNILKLRWLKNFDEVLRMAEIRYPNREYEWHLEGRNKRDPPRHTLWGQCD